MKLWLATLLFSLSALAHEAATLSLRAHVPSIYRIHINSDGTLVTHSNHPSTQATPTIERVDKNGITLITVIHP
ncbi:MAG: hypothetical protein ACLGG0_13195 [Bacteriovoracia bacterium]